MQLNEHLKKLKTTSLEVMFSQLQLAVQLTRTGSSNESSGVFSVIYIAFW